MERLDDIERNICRIEKASNEDILVMNLEIEKLRKKVIKLESKVKVLVAQKT